MRRQLHVQVLASGLGLGLLLLLLLVVVLLMVLTRILVLSLLLVLVLLRSLWVDRVVKGWQLRDRSGIRMRLVVRPIVSRVVKSARRLVLPMLRYDRGLPWHGADDLVGV